MKVNGTKFFDYALDRFCEYENDCTIIERKDSCDEIHSDITDYCFFITESDGTERHDYGPNNWSDRKKAYDMVNKYFNKEI